MLSAGEYLSDPNGNKNQKKDGQDTQVVRNGSF